MNDPLLPLEEALNQLLNVVSPNQQTESLSLLHASNRVLAQDVRATITQPPFDNSAVDGYAVRGNDCANNASLPVMLRITAGSKVEELAPNTAARIFTGAPVPKGADSVLMQEFVDLSESAEAPSVRTEREVVVGQNIRRAGQDFHANQIIAEQGDLLTPQRVALLAAAGVSEVLVYRRLQIAILSTGDELIDPGTPLTAGQIYNSNRFLLNSILTNYNVDVIDLGTVADSLEDTLNALRKAADSDLILTTGGASVGEEDHVKAAIRALGELRFWRIALKPGKPFMLGNIQGTPILGLPGNPSAVFVTTLLLARPVILKLSGLKTTSVRSYSLPLSKSQKKQSVRREFLRVQIDDTGQLAPHPNQSSGMTSSLCWAEGFAVIRENTCPQAGDLVEYIPIDELTHLPNTRLDLS